MPFETGIRIGLVDRMLSLCYHALSDPEIIYCQQHTRCKTMSKFMISILAETMSLNIYDV